jgi:hypothetical protein
VNEKCEFSIRYTEGSSLEGYYSSDFIIVGEELQDYWENKELYN